MLLLENFSYVEVEEYLQTNNTLLIPVGSVEQHSPYGLIGTDFITAEAVARRVGEELGILVAPTISYGVSPHHMGFKGTATLSLDTFISIVMDLTLSFSSHGFRRIFFINGHGGNKPGLEVAMQKVKIVNTPGQFHVFAWYEGLKETELLQDLFKDDDGSHATPSEVSLTRLLRPDAFLNKPTEPKDVEKPEYYWPLSSVEMKEVFPDGRICSAPWLASAEKGRLIFDYAVNVLTEKINTARQIEIVG